MAIDQENKDKALERIKRAALAGGLSGAGWGALGSVIKGGSPKNIALSALKGGAIGGVGLPAALGVGQAVLPDSDDQGNPNTARATVGAGLRGGLGGTLGAAYLAKKYKLGLPGKVTGDNNVVIQKILELTANPEKRALGMALGGTAGALAGGAWGLDEGVGLDALEHEIKARRRKKLMEGNQV